ncbi:MAG: cytochrome c oxidase subunit 3 [Candidatus Poribacteria bacterium]|nr:cytochrome c oxidase subunit 3 [Candidatus Poribacteria bacterium]
MMVQTDFQMTENRPLSNAKLAVLILLGSETMLFSGLIGAFLVFRMGSVAWPPLSLAEIQLPRLVTGINTILLVISGYTMFQALRSIQLDRVKLFQNLLILTGALGLVFLIIQGWEWIQLIEKGLTLQSGVYGAIFYVLIGCHAVHVLGAVIWLTIVIGMAISGRFSSDSHIGVETCTIYWIYVVALWPILYFLVYFA